MNENIERMVKLAGITRRQNTYAADYWQGPESSFEDFARLIAEDCATIIPIGDRTQKQAIYERYGVT